MSAAKPPIAVPGQTAGTAGIAFIDGSFVPMSATVSHPVLLRCFTLLRKFTT